MKKNLVIIIFCLGIICQAQNPQRKLQTSTWTEEPIDPTIDPKMDPINDYIDAVGDSGDYVNDASSDDYKDYDYYEPYKEKTFNVYVTSNQCYSYDFIHEEIIKANISGTLTEEERMNLEKKNSYSFRYPPCEEGARAKIPFKMRVSSITILRDDIEEYISMWYIQNYTRYNYDDYYGDYNDTDIKYDDYSGSDYYGDYNETDIDYDYYNDATMSSDDAKRRLQTTTEVAKEENSENYQDYQDPLEIYQQFETILAERFDISWVVAGAYQLNEQQMNQKLSCSLQDHVKNLKDQIKPTQDALLTKPDYVREVIPILDQHSVFQQADWQQYDSYQNFEYCYDGMGTSSDAWAMENYQNSYYTEQLVAVDQIYIDNMQVQLETNRVNGVYPAYIEISADAFETGIQYIFNVTITEKANATNTLNLQITGYSLQEKNIELVEDETLITVAENNEGNLDISVNCADFTADVTQCEAARITIFQNYFWEEFNWQYYTYTYNELTKNNIEQTIIERKEKELRRYNENKKAFFEGKGPQLFTYYQKSLLDLEQTLFDMITELKTIKLSPSLIDSLPSDPDTYYSTLTPEQYGDLWYSQQWYEQSSVDVGTKQQILENFKTMINEHLANKKNFTEVFTELRKKYWDQTTLVEDQTEAINFYLLLKYKKGYINNDLVQIDRDIQKFGQENFERYGEIFNLSPPCIFEDQQLKYNFFQQVKTLPAEEFPSYMDKLIHRVNYLLGLTRLEIQYQYEWSYYDLGGHQVYNEDAKNPLDEAQNYANSTNTPKTSGEGEGTSEEPTNTNELPTQSPEGPESPDSDQLTRRRQLQTTTSTDSTTTSDEGVATSSDSTISSDGTSDSVQSDMQIFLNTLAQTDLQTVSMYVDDGSEPQEIVCGENITYQGIPIGCLVTSNGLHVYPPLPFEYNGIDVLYASSELEPVEYFYPFFIYNDKVYYLDDSFEKTTTVDPLISDNTMEVFQELYIIKIKELNLFEEPNYNVEIQEILKNVVPEDLGKAQIYLEKTQEQLLIECTSDITYGDVKVGCLLTADGLQIYPPLPFSYKNETIYEAFTSNDIYIGSGMPFFITDGEIQYFWDNEIIDFLTPDPTINSLDIKSLLEVYYKYCDQIYSDYEKDYDYQDDYKYVPNWYDFLYLPDPIVQSTVQFDEVKSHTVTVNSGDQFFGDKKFIIQAQILINGVEKRIYKIIDLKGHAYFEDELPRDLGFFLNMPMREQNVSFDALKNLSPEEQLDQVKDMDSAGLESLFNSNMGAVADSDAASDSVPTNNGEAQPTSNTSDDGTQTESKCGQNGCNGNGECILDETINKHKCKCNVGFQGLKCSLTAEQQEFLVQLSNTIIQNSLNFDPTAESVTEEQKNEFKNKALLVGNSDALQADQIKNTQKVLDIFLDFAETMNDDEAMKVVNSISNLKNVEQANAVVDTDSEMQRSKQLDKLGKVLFKSLSNEAKKEIKSDDMIMTIHKVTIGEQIELSSEAELKNDDGTVAKVPKINVPVIEGVAGLAVTFVKKDNFKSITNDLPVASNFVQLVAFQEDGSEKKLENLETPLRFEIQVQNVSQDQNYLPQYVDEVTKQLSSEGLTFIELKGDIVVFESIHATTYGVVSETKVTTPVIKDDKKTTDNSNNSKLTSVIIILVIMFLI